MITQIKAKAELSVLSLAPGIAPKRNTYLTDVDSQMGELQLTWVAALGDLEAAMRERNRMSSECRSYLAGVGRTSEAIKDLELELAAQVPAENSSGRKLTVAERETWIEKAKRIDPRYQESIQRQSLAQAQLDEIELGITMAEKKLVYLRLQIEYVNNALRFLGQ